MTDVGNETTFRLDQCKHFQKSKHLLRSEVSWCDQTSKDLHLRRSTSTSEKIDRHSQRNGFRAKRNHFRGQSSRRGLFGHTGCWSIAECSQISCRNYTGGFRSWPPAICKFSTRRSFDHHGKGNGNFVQRRVSKNEKRSRISHWSESDENAKWPRDCLWVWLCLACKRSFTCRPMWRNLRQEAHSYPQVDVCSAPHSDHDDTHTHI